MDTKQPEALRIAEWLEGIRGNTWPSYIPQEAAAELRRQHAEIETLRAGYDAARLEIASLHTQMEAVGAGGMEPLRKRCLHQISEPQAQPVGAEPVAWQPIATAPRDGTNILIRFGSDGDSQAKYIPGLTRPWKFIDTNDEITWLINHAVDGPGGPSHWMQFPPYRKAAAPQPAAQALDAQQYANRYRHIRCFGLPMDAFGDCDSYYGVYTSQTGECLDAAIDAAISAQQGGANV